MLQLLRILFLLMILLIIVLGGTGYWFYENKLKAPFPMVNDLHYTVPPGANLSQVAMDLMDKEILDYPSALTWVMLARFQQRANLIKAGDYVIKVGITPQQFLETMIKGKTTQHTFWRIPPSEANFHQT